MMNVDSYRNSALSVSGLRKRRKEKLVGIYYIVLLRVAVLFAE